MKVFGTKRLLPILIPLFLALSAATPKLSAQSLFGPLQGPPSVLVYGFVWIPILEISVMIAQHILPPQAMTSPAANSNTSKGDTQQGSTPDYASNAFTNRELMPIRQCAPEGSDRQSILTATERLIPAPCSPRSSQSPGILLLVSLVFLFKSLLPRCDIPVILASRHTRYVYEKR